MKFFRILILLIIFLFKSQILFAQDLVFIDINYIINNSIAGKRILNELELTNKKNLTLLKNKQLELNKERNEIESKKNIISEEKIKFEINSLNNKISNFQNKQQQMSNDFKELNRIKINELIRKINPIIEKYMTQNNIKIIFNKESVYVSLEDGDITDDVIKLVDSVLN